MIEFKCTQTPDTPETYPAVTFTMPDDANLTDMCRAFELFLKACTYNFDGEVKIVGDKDE